MELNDPPHYALIRGPLPKIGYEVATLSPPEDPTPSVVLLFSSEKKARKYMHSLPGGTHWKVGPLPSWKRTLLFLENMKKTVKYFCLDYQRDLEIEDFTVPLETVLPDVKARADAERTAET